MTIWTIRGVTILKTLIDRYSIFYKLFIGHYLSENLESDQKVKKVTGKIIILYIAYRHIWFSC